MRIHEKRFIILSLVGKSRDAKKSFVKSKKFSIIKGEVKSLKNKRILPVFPNELADQKYPIMVKKAFREKKM